MRDLIQLYSIKMSAPLWSFTVDFSSRSFQMKLLKIKLIKGGKQEIIFCGQSNIFKKILRHIKICSKHLV